jgi:hypothetical protein
MGGNVYELSLTRIAKATGETRRDTGLPARNRRIRAQWSTSPRDQKGGR